MLTTIEIIAVDTIDFTFGEVLSLAERRINAYLESSGILFYPELEALLHHDEGNYIRRIAPDDRFTWKENEFIRFTIRNAPGGADGCCSPVSDSYEEDEPWWRLNNIAEKNTHIPDFNEKLERAKKLDTSWSFRAAGQPRFSCIVYGLIAASVAELSNGFLWSDDDAWDPERFPTESSDFLSWYFIPEKALSPDMKRWAEHCISWLEDELAEEKPKRNWWKRMFGSV